MKYLRLCRFIIVLVCASAPTFAITDAEILASYAAIAEAPLSKKHIRNNQPLVQIHHDYAFEKGRVSHEMRRKVWAAMGGDDARAIRRHRVRYILSDVFPEKNIYIAQRKEEHPHFIVQHDRGDSLIVMPTLQEALKTMGRAPQPHRSTSVCEHITGALLGAARFYVRAAASPAGRLALFLSGTHVGTVYAQEQGALTPGSTPLSALSEAHAQNVFALATTSPRLRGAFGEPMDTSTDTPMPPESHAEHAPAGDFRFPSYSSQFHKVEGPCVGFEFETIGSYGIKAIIKGATVPITHTKDNLFVNIEDYGEFGLQSDNGHLELVTYPLPANDDDIFQKTLNVVSRFFRFLRTQNGRSYDQGISMEYELAASSIRTAGPRLNIPSATGRGVWQGTEYRDPESGDRILDERYKIIATSDDVAFKPQASMGVRLSRVPTLFAAIVAADDSSKTGYRVGTAGTRDVLSWALGAWDAKKGGEHCAPIEAQADAKGLALYVVHYLERAQTNFPTALEDAKYAFPLMARTDFHSMFVSMPGGAQTAFADNILNCMKAVLETGDLNIDTFRKAYPGDDKAGHKGPKIQDWLASIIAGAGTRDGKDLLSPPLGYAPHSERPEGMGVMGMDGNYLVLEFRDVATTATVARAPDAVTLEIYGIMHDIHALAKGVDA